MNVKKWLSNTCVSLNAAGIETARLDCLVLLEDVTSKDRGWLLAHPEYVLRASEIYNLDAKISQRLQHVPLAYIRGKAEFYGREFAVTKHTLVPRPETETMIDMLLQQHTAAQPNSLPSSPSRPMQPIYRERDLHIVDVGTGSGALAITAKLELPDAVVSAIDIDDDCLTTAQRNSAILGASIRFLKGNLLEPLHDIKNDRSNYTLLCNLPYVPESFHINTAAAHEPHKALFGGKDGLELYRTLFNQIQTNTSKPTCILTESLPSQHKDLSIIAKTAGYGLAMTNDFIQMFEPQLLH